MSLKNYNWRKYGFEFLSIFIAVISAFMLNNWNENRKDDKAETKILAEIANGLKKDLEDIRLNKIGHEQGIYSCEFWRDVIQNKKVKQDSVPHHYIILTRDFISIQNVSGYETLKSKGLELINNDSLRWAIISLYEYDFNILRKFEEEYAEMQYQVSFFHEINNILAPHLIFNEEGNLKGIELPLEISASEKKLLLSYLWKIEANRQFIMHYYYVDIEKKVNDVLTRIEQELD